MVIRRPNFFHYLLKKVGLGALVVIRQSKFSCCSPDRSTNFKLSSAELIYYPTHPQTALLATNPRRLTHCILRFHATNTNLTKRGYADALISRYSSCMCCSPFNLCTLLRGQIAKAPWTWWKLEDFKPSNS